MTKIILKPTISKILSLVLILFVSACTGNKNQDGSAPEEFDQAVEELKDQIEDIVYKIPPPAEIPYILQSTGVEFDEGLVNDINKTDSYQNDNNKTALNLGVYAADIGYLSNYGKAQKALSYLTAAKPLADQIGVTGALEQQVIERFESNLSMKDSLTHIIDEVIENADQHLKGADRNEAAALMLTGSFAEGLYIACSLVRDYPRDILSEENRKLILIPLVRLILEQEKPLEDLNKLLNSLDGNATTNELVGMTGELSARFEALNVEEKIANNEGITLLEDETLVGVTDQVIKIREYITN